MASQIVFEHRSNREMAKHHQGHPSGGSTSDRRYHITSYSIVAAATVVMVLAAALFGAWVMADSLGVWMRGVGDGTGSAEYAGDMYVTKQVIVSRGDTLWKIASLHGPHGVDVREVVDWIRTKNRLSRVTLYPGQALVVPVVR